MLDTNLLDLPDEVLITIGALLIATCGLQQGWRLALACKRLAGLRGDWLQQVAVDRGTPFHLELNWGSIVARVANNSRLFGWDLWFAKWQREGITLGTQSLLRQCPLLESLRLTHPWVGEQLAEVSGLQSLTHLSLAHIKLTELPPSISVLSQLRSLDLTGNELEGGLEMLPTGLTILRADTASQKGPWLSRLLSLERLMSSSPVSAQDAPHMSALTALRDLHISHMAVSPDSRAALAQLPNLEGVHVKASGSHMKWVAEPGAALKDKVTGITTHPGTLSFVRHLQPSQLRVLDLGTDYCGVEDCRIIERFTALEVLRLDHCRVPDWLQNMRQLRSLTLQTTDSAHLERSLKPLTKLTALHHYHKLHYRPDTVTDLSGLTTLRELGLRLFRVLPTLPGSVTNLFVRAQPRAYGDDSGTARLFPELLAVTGLRRLTYATCAHDGYSPADIKGLTALTALTELAVHKGDDFHGGTLGELRDAVDDDGFIMRAGFNAANAAFLAPARTDPYVCGSYIF